MHNSYTCAVVGRYSSHPPVLTLLLLVLLCCTAGCLAAIPHRCIHGEISRKNRATGVVREIPHRGQGAMQAYTASAAITEEEKNKLNWAPIRIKAFTRDLDDPSKYCSGIGEVRYDALNDIIYCGANDILTVRMKRIIVEQIIPEAIKMHSERLSVVPTEGIKVPRMSGGYCGYFNIPEEHHTEGLVDADLYIYVSAMPSRDTAAWAVSCSYLKDKRPYAGVINLTPSYVKPTDSFIRVMVHEIGHILGYDEFTFAALNIIGTHTNVRGKKKVWIINTTKSRDVARKYFDCPNASGVELENQGAASARSHIEERNAREDFMAPGAMIGRYSVLSLAIFDSMPFYKANFDKAEPMKWGNKSGCKFLDEKCIKDGKSSFPEMVCDTPFPKVLNLCTLDRLALGYCTLKEHDYVLAEEYRYFPDNNRYGGSNNFMDFCPIVGRHREPWCTKSFSLNGEGSYVGPDSRCVKGEGLKYMKRAIGDVCVKTDCNKEKKKLRVQFYESQTWYECEEGKKITPKSFYLWSGNIICPKYEEVCDVLPNLSIVLDPLPVKEDDDNPAPGNITWKIPESAMEDRNEEGEVNPSVNDESASPHTSNGAGSQGSITHNDPTTGTTVRGETNIPDVHIGDHDTIIDPTEAPSKNVQGGTTHLPNNTAGITLNIGVGDGSVTAAGCAPLLFLVVAVAVAVSL
ncbi:leishmanolysin [Trypanosoma theileri]|uniref:Leishmanolysin-like peptidase n=1 Tax=Trypanosoma theileri TaxID=67003 RepID=A0A1X0P5J0_9TRYP|nr:leishmanolysin [Trypanosoma theileri]ORC92214.1 leishmanolysin [Trypanosoma theileri]